MISILMAAILSQATTVGAPPASPRQVIEVQTQTEIVVPSLLAPAMLPLVKCLMLKKASECDAERTKAKVEANEALARPLSDYHRGDIVGVLIRNVETIASFDRAQKMVPPDLSRCRKVDRPGSAPLLLCNPRPPE